MAEGLTISALLKEKGVSETNATDITPVSTNIDNADTFSSLCRECNQIDDTESENLALTKYSELSERMYKVLCTKWSNCRSMFNTTPNTSLFIRCYLWALCKMIYVNHSATAAFEIGYMMMIGYLPRRVDCKELNVVVKETVGVTRVQRVCGRTAMQFFELSREYGNEKALEFVKICKEAEWYEKLWLKHQQPTSDIVEIEKGFYKKNYYWLLPYVLCRHYSPQRTEKNLFYWYNICMKIKGLKDTDPNVYLNPAVEEIIRRYERMPNVLKKYNRESLVKYGVPSVAIGIVSLILLVTFNIGLLFIVFALSLCTGLAKVSSSWLDIKKPRENTVNRVLNAYYKYDREPIDIEDDSIFLGSVA